MLDLTAYPKPRKGIGIHLWPNPYGMNIEYWLDKVVDMKMDTVTTLNTELGFMQAAAARGLFVISRPFIRTNQEWGDDGSCVENMQAAGLAPYIQIYNEPELFGVEWGDDVPNDEQWARETWANRWLSAAQYIFNRGGYPGIQVLDLGWYRYLLQRIKNEHPEIIKRLWFSCHNYMSNHPIDYMQDEFGWLAPLWFDKVANEVLGHSLPTICTEGGWCVGDAADNRFPTIDEALHAKYTKGSFDVFRTGVLPTGESLPDWWLGITPWLLVSVAVGGDSAFEQNAWFGAWHPDRQLTIDAVKNIPEFVRSWNGEVVPQPEPEPIPEPIEEEDTMPEFAFGFKDLHDQYPDEIGDAVSEQMDLLVAPDGTVLHARQATTNGELVYYSGSGVKFIKQSLPLA